MTKRGRLRTPAKLAGMLVVVALLVAACSSEPAADDRPTIVATTSVVGDLVSNVVGAGAEVVVIIGPGVDPHDFQASVRQVESIANADLVVGIGLGLEESLLDVIDAGSSKLLLLGPQLDPIEFRDDGHDTDDGGHAFDPHVWQDPGRMAVAVELIGDRLDGIVDGATESARTYADALRALDSEVAEQVSEIPTDRRVMVTTHEAFGYYADAYGFEIIGVIVRGGTTLSEPSAADLEQLARTIEESGTPAIFTEATHPTTLARAVSDEVGRPVEIVELISDALTADVPTYVEMIRTNTDRIVEALG